MKKSATEVATWLRELWPAADVSIETINPEHPHPRELIQFRLYAHWFEIEPIEWNLFCFQVMPAIEIPGWDDSDVLDLDSLKSEMEYHLYGNDTSLLEYPCRCSSCRGEDDED